MARRQRVEIEREARDERLALAGLHLGDVALVEDDAAHHLDVEHALVGLAHTRLADGGVRLEEQVLEHLAVVEPLPELGRLRAQLLVRERLELGLERRDVRGLVLNPLHATALADAENLFESAELRHHRQGTARRGPNCRSAALGSSYSGSTDDLPGLAAEPVCADDVLGPLECGDRAESVPAVDDERPLAVVDGELDLVAGDSGQVENLDRARGDGPEIAVATDRLGAVRRCELALRPPRASGSMPPGPSSTTTLVAGERDEPRAVGLQPGRPRSSRRRPTGAAGGGRGSPRGRTRRRALPVLRLDGGSLVSESPASRARRTWSGSPRRNSSGSDGLARRAL